MVDVFLETILLIDTVWIVASGDTRKQELGTNLSKHDTKSEGKPVILLN